MNRKILTPISAIAFLCCMLILAACNKTEFLPDPEGAQVPFKPEGTQSVEELLATSSATLYYSAWQKSNIKKILTEKGPKVRITVFAPDDAAMQSAGLSAAVIDQMPVEELDSLMMFYTVVGDITADELRRRTDNLVAKTMLGIPGLYSKYYEGSELGGVDNFHYRHYLAIVGDQLLANGKSTGPLNYKPATNGGLYVMGKAIERVRKTMMQVLKEDGRFTMFLESMRLTDEMFIDKVASDIEPLFGYKPDPQEIKSSYASERKYYEKGLGIEPDLGWPSPNIISSAVFAPTDEAFRKAGFQTIDDIMQFNAERGTAKFDENIFQASGGYPMDTIFSYHRDWGRVDATKDPSYGIAADNATVFYSNVLNSSLNNYMVNIGGNAQAIFAYRMPFDFSRSNSGIQMAIRGAEQSPISLIETDINTLNGPVHVVDQLFIPKGFKIK